MDFSQLEGDKLSELGEDIEPINIALTSEIYLFDRIHKRYF